MAAASESAAGAVAAAADEGAKLSTGQPVEEAVWEFVALCDYPNTPDDKTIHLRIAAKYVREDVQLIATNIAAKARKIEHKILSSPPEHTDKFPGSDDHCLYLAYFVVSQGKADYEKALEDYNHLASFVKDSREAFFYAYAPFEDEVFLEDREEWDDEYADYLLGTKAFPKED